MRLMVTRGVRNPTIVHPQWLPAMKLRMTRPSYGDVPLSGGFSFTVLGSVL